jgi:hypothetical protein
MANRIPDTYPKDSVMRLASSLKSKGCRSISIEDVTQSMRKEYGLEKKHAKKIVEVVNNVLDAMYFTEKRTTAVCSNRPAIPITRCDAPKSVKDNIDIFSMLSFVASLAVLIFRFLFDMVQALFFTLWVSIPKIWYASMNFCTWAKPIVFNMTTFGYTNISWLCRLLVSKIVDGVHVCHELLLVGSSIVSNILKACVKSIYSSLLITMSVLFRTLWNINVWLESILNEDVTLSPLIVAKKTQIYYQPPMKVTSSSSLESSRLWRYYVWLESILNEDGEDDSYHFMHSYIVSFEKEIENLLELVYPIYILLEITLNCSDDSSLASIHSTSTMYAPALYRLSVVCSGIWEVYIWMESVCNTKTDVESSIHPSEFDQLIQKLSQPVYSLNRSLEAILNCSDDSSEMILQT